MNSPALRPIDVFFRGHRPYIQGSLLIAQSIARFADRLQPELPAPHLASATFRRIIDHHCAVAWAPVADLPVLGSITVASRMSDRRHVLTIHPDASRPEPPPRRADSAAVIAGPVRDSDKAFSTELAAAEPDMDALLRGVVELNRFCYQALFDGSDDFIFSALFDGSYPLDTKHVAAAGALRFELLSSRRTGDTTSGISRTSLITATREIGACIQFAFREKQT